jgi:hypothetical protein
VKKRFSLAAAGLFWIVLGCHSLWSQFLPATSNAVFRVVKRRTVMAAMLQLLTYLLAFYLVVEILQIALALSKENRGGMIALGVLVLIACMIAAGAFVDYSQLSLHLRNSKSGASALAKGS